MKVTIETIKHEDQRYPTLGDWQWHMARFNRDNDELTIKVSKMVNGDYEFLIMLHEFVEAYLCMRHGIPESVIDEFDKKYEAQRPIGDNSEPGDDIECPYRREHRFASLIESQVAEELNVSESLYQRACDRMFLYSKASQKAIDDFESEVGTSKMERYVEYVTGIHDKPLGPKQAGDKEVERMTEMCTCHMEGSNVNVVKPCPIHGGT